MRDDVHVLRMPEPIRGSCELTLDRWPDDVIVDFPSIAALVDRMQAAFFGGEAEVRPVAAEVELSRGQAFRGGRVPVEVPLRRLCRACGGRGEVWDQPCGDCDGTGDRVNVEAVHVFVPSGVRDGARFRLRVRVPTDSQTAVDLRVRVR
jgi:hypothetical protein